MFEFVNLDALDTEVRANGIASIKYITLSERHWVQAVTLGTQKQFLHLK